MDVTTILCKTRCEFELGMEEKSFYLNIYCDKQKHKFTLEHRKASES
jgi:hypothetical protein